MKNYYEILEVSQNALDSEIRARYFDLAKKYHPDVNKETDAANLFKDINEAYATLSDSLRRADYDQRLEGVFIRKKEEEKKEATKEETPKPSTAMDFMAAFGRMIFSGVIGFLIGGLVESVVWYFAIKSNFTISLLYPGMLWGTIAGLFWGADLNFNVESYLGPGYMGRTYTFMRTILYALSFAYLLGRFSLVLKPMVDSTLIQLAGMTIGLMIGATLGSQGEGVFMLSSKKGRKNLLYTLLRSFEIGIIGLILGGILGYVIELVANIQITVWASYLGFLLGLIVGAISPPNLQAYASYASAAVKNTMVILIAAFTLILGVVFSYIFHAQIELLISGKFLEWF